MFGSPRKTGFADGESGNCKLKERDDLRAGQGCRAAKCADFRLGFAFRGYTPGVCRQSVRKRLITWMLRETRLQKSAQVVDSTWPHCCVWSGLYCARRILSARKGKCMRRPRSVTHRYSTTDVIKGQAKHGCFVRAMSMTKSWAERNNSRPGSVGFRHFASIWSPFRTSATDVRR